MLVFLLGLAQAYESTPQSLIVSDVIELFNATEIDSGWVPQNGPLGIRLQVIADGGANVYMEGNGLLAWPTDLNFSAQPSAGAGYIALDTSITTSISVKIDFGGIQWEQPIIEEGIDFFTEKWFEPFLLAEQISLSDSSTGAQPWRSRNPSRMARIDRSPSYGRGCSVSLQ